MSNIPVDPKIAALKEDLRRVFPAVTYHGPITTADGRWTPELDDDQDVYEHLKGLSWPQAPTSLMLGQPDGYLLLADAAFTAFLPAWLMLSLERAEEHEDEIREFLIYSFSSTLRQFRLLNPEQRELVRSIIAEFHLRITDAFVKSSANEALELIDRLAQQDAT